MFVSDSMGNDRVQQQMTVSLMNISKEQEKAVMAKLLEGMNATPQMASPASREGIPTGQKLNIIA